MTKVSKNDKNAEEKVQYASVLGGSYKFLNEKMSLMYLGEPLQVEVDQSSKSHPELAEEGIKYSWEQAKSEYH